jgi:crotonobetainyl-CoA:carnitine CoA-transferase CaiB-like acyl-CoA transferase
LERFRVLDLTEGGYNLGAKVLADLGADVIRIEPPGGSPTRLTPPFYHDDPDPEKSLFWFAFNLNKRGITLNLESADGRELFRRLASKADVVMESFTPGHLEDLGIGYPQLSRLNPRLVVTSVTPFGQTGPFSRFKATDIVSWAQGGMLYLSGDQDRPPVRISFPVSEAVAGSQAAAGTMHALWHAINTGEGQQVDVSAQEAVLWLTLLEPPYPILTGYYLRREGIHRGFDFVTWRQLYPCKDGHVSIYLMGGPAGAFSMRALVKWMDEEGIATPELREKKWEEWSPGDLFRMGEEKALEEIRKVEEATEKLFARHSKEEVFDRAVRDRILMAPSYNAADLAGEVQLQARDFWKEVEHPELGGTIVYPGELVKLSGTPIRFRRRPPLIGEHNQEVYCGELGLSAQEYGDLRSTGAV